MAGFWFGLELSGALFGSFLAGLLFWLVGPSWVSLGRPLVVAGAEWGPLGFLLAVVWLWLELSGALLGLSWPASGFGWS